MSMNIANEPEVVLEAVLQVTMLQPYIRHSAIEDMTH